MCCNVLVYLACAAPPHRAVSYSPFDILSFFLFFFFKIPLLQAHPQLKQCVRQSVERAVQELVHPVVDRSIKIAMTTCEQIVRKDFALDSEESRMRVAAHHMMRNLTAGMAMITCREPLLMSIATNLKNSFAAALRVSLNKGLSEMLVPQQDHVNCENEDGLIMSIDLVNAHD